MKPLRAIVHDLLAERRGREGRVEHYFARSRPRMLPFHVAMVDHEPP